MKPRIIHVIAPYEGKSALAKRQALFLESVDRADREGVIQIAAIEDCWSHPGWQTAHLDRDARELGDKTKKPFIRDLFDLGLSLANPDDWLFYSNVDCSVVPDTFQRLRRSAGYGRRICAPRHRR